MPGMDKPRLRIAPSPTGAMHIGTARTALYNWLLARRSGGQFVVRIEDTDKKRSEKKYEQDIIENLEWLGLNWDEGPNVGGPYGPYCQSQRTGLYTAALQRLIDNNSVFYCFHTKEELAQEREIQTAAKISPVHVCDHKSLPRAEVVKRLKEQAVPKDRQGSVLRFAAPRETIAFHDLIRGEVKIKAELLGDFVVAKSLTEPLYNFAAVVDDHAMAISHVLRGEEHLSNTPSQLLMYRALGYAPPIFGHLPLILAPDRSKMSKRFGATAVAAYRAAGYLPEALLNFVAFLGWNPGGEEEIFSLPELIQKFSADRIRKSGAIFNEKRLDWFNGQFIRRLTSDEFLKSVEPFFDRRAIAKTQYPWRDDEIAAILLSEQSRIRRLNEIVDNVALYFNGEPPGYDPALLSWQQGMAPAAIKVALERCRTILEGIAETRWLKADIEAALLPVAGEYKDRGELLWPLRVALTGRKQSPGPFEVSALLGKARTLARLDQAINLLK